MSLGIELGWLLGSEDGAIDGDTLGAGEADGAGLGQYPGGTSIDLAQTVSLIHMELSLILWNTPGNSPQGSAPQESVPTRMSCSAELPNIRRGPPL
jgi:hypothetical protein